MLRLPLPVLLVAFSTLAEAGTFTALFQESRSFGNPGARVSADGGTVVSYPETGGEPAVWNSNLGVRRFPRSVFLRGVSGDGSAIVGSSPNGPNGPPIATVWEPSGRITDSFRAGISSYAWDVSGDGSTVVGGYVDGTQRAAIWRNGVRAPIDPVGSSTRSTAFAVSDDGSVVIGTTDLLDGPRKPFVWSDETGIKALQGVAGTESRSGTARGVSADGRYVVGDQHMVGVDQLAFVWTERDGMRVLDDLLGGPTFGSAFATTKGAERIVGTGRSSTGQEAVIWESDRQPQLLQTYLEDSYGINLTGWLLRVATDITPDGSVIVGTGRGPDGAEYVWRAEISPIPEPGTYLSGLVCVVAVTIVRGRA